MSGDERQKAAEQHAHDTEAFSGQTLTNALNDFVAGCEWEAEHGAGPQGGPGMSDRRAAAAACPACNGFRYSGPLPDGYEFHVVTAERGYVSLKTRARRIDGTWNGPWRQQGRGGLVVGDAWKHATGATDADIDEAGAG